MAGHRYDNQSVRSVETSKADRIAVDHRLHWLAVFAAAAYAWQLHGWLLASLVLIGLPLVIAITNLAAMFLAPSFVVIRVNRWAWVVVTFVLLALSGAEGDRI